MSNAERLIALQGERAECHRRLKKYRNAPLEGDIKNAESVRKFLYDKLEPAIRELTDRVIKETWEEGLLSLGLKDKLQEAAATGLDGSPGDPLAIAVLRELELD
jgi:hypothetical protein